MEQDVLDRKESRKEQLRQQTRLEILQATAQLIAQKGVANLSMDEVASIVGISKGSLYNYLGNRDELIWLVVDTYHQHFLDQVNPILEDQSVPFRERFSALVDLTLHSLEKETGLAAVLDYFEEQIGKARFEARTGVENPYANMLQYVQRFHQRFEPFFSQALTRGEIRGNDGMDISVAFVTVIFHLFEFTRLGLLHGDRERHKQFALSLFLP